MFSDNTNFHKSPQSLATDINGAKVNSKKFILSASVKIFSPIFLTTDVLMFRRRKFRFPFLPFSCLQVGHDFVKKVPARLWTAEANFDGFSSSKSADLLAGKKRKYMAVPSIAFVVVPSRRPIEIRRLLNTEFYEPPHLTLAPEHAALLAPLITRLIPRLVFLKILLFQPSRCLHTANNVTLTA